MASDPPQIDMKRSEYRRSFNGPLGKPWALALSLAGFLGASVFCASLASWQGGFWWALAPIPTAMWAGVALAGLFPREFFHNN